MSNGARRFHRFRDGHPILKKAERDRKKFYSKPYRAGDFSEINERTCEHAFFELQDAGLWMLADICHHASMFFALHTKYEYARKAMIEQTLKLNAAEEQRTRLRSRIAELELRICNMKQERKTRRTKTR